MGPRLREDDSVERRWALRGRWYGRTDTKPRGAGLLSGTSAAPKGGRPDIPEQESSRALGACSQACLAGGNKIEREEPSMLNQDAAREGNRLRGLAVALTALAAIALGAGPAR